MYADNVELPAAAAATEMHGEWSRGKLPHGGDNWKLKKTNAISISGPRPRGRPKRTQTEVVKEDCQARKLNKEDAMDRCKWRKLIKDVRWSGWVCWWVFLLVPAHPGSSGPKAVKRSCVCVCVHAAANDRYQTARLTATTGLLLPAHAGTDRWTDGHHTVS